MDTVDQKEIDADNTAHQKSWWATERDRYNEKRQTFKSGLCAGARFRGRKRGLDATITPDDLVWPTHCPVLGLALDYPKYAGQRGAQNCQPNWPSLDRWDSSKGYVPGNVFVISYRANTIKNNATWQELHAVMTYARGGVGAVRHGRFPSSLRRYSSVTADD